MKSISAFASGTLLSAAIVGSVSPAQAQTTSSSLPVPHINVAPMQIVAPNAGALSSTTTSGTVTVKENTSGSVGNVISNADRFLQKESEKPFYGVSIPLSSTDPQGARFAMTNDPTSPVRLWVTWNLNHIIPPSEKNSSDTEKIHAAPKDSLYFWVGVTQNRTSVSFGFGIGKKF